MLDAAKADGTSIPPLRVWGRRTSVNVQRVMWAIGELGLPYQRYDVGGEFGGLDSREFKVLNPNGLVPVLQDGETTLWESGVIARYLVLAYGAGRLGAPPSASNIAGPSIAARWAAAEQWHDWALGTLYRDIIGVLFYAYARTPEAERQQAPIDRAARKVGQWLRVLDDHLAERPYIMGDELTIADLGPGTLMYRYYTLPIERPALPRVEAWYERLCRRPAFAEHVMVDYWGGRTAQPAAVGG